MNFLINKDEMLASLSKCIGIASKGGSPLTENVKVDVFDENITLTTSDSQTQIIAFCKPSKIKTTGATCVNAKKINDLFRLLPDKEKINVFLDGHSLKIKTGGGSWEISNFPTEDFPTFTSDSGEGVSVKISSESLFELISKTSISLPRSQLGSKTSDGIFFEYLENELSATTYCGHRISTAKMSSTAHSTTVNSNNADVDSGSESSTFEGLSASCIVPRRAVSEINKIISGISEEVEFLIERNMITLKTGSFELKSSLILKDFIKYQTVLNPPDFSLIKLNTKEFSDALNRAALLADPDMKRKEVALFCSKDKMVIESLNKLSAEKSSESIGIDYGGDEFQVFFTCKYLLDALSVIGSEITEIISYWDPHKIDGSPIYRWILKHENKENFRFWVPARTPVVIASSLSESG